MLTLVLYEHVLLVRSK